MIPLLLGAGAVLGIGGAIGKAKQEKKAARAQARANRIQQAQSEIAAQETRRSAERARRIRMAQVQNIAAQTGTAGSAGELGALGSIQTQAATQARLSNIGEAGAAGISTQLAEVQRRREKAATFGAVSSIGGSLFNLGGGFEGLAETSIFSSTPTAVDNLSAGSLAR